MTVSVNKRPVCVVVPGLALEGDVGRAALLAMALENDVKLCFPEYEDNRSADVIVVGSAEAGVPRSPASYVIVNPSLGVLCDSDLNELSRILSVACDGLSPTQTDTVPDCPLGVADLLQTVLSERPRPDHPLLDFLASGPAKVADSIHLPLEMFAIDARHSDREKSLGRVGLAGRARYLIYGAYHWLPRGTWTATIIFSVDREAATQHFRIEWGLVNDFVSHSFCLSGEGKYSISINATLAVAAQIELRFILANSSLGGEMEVFDIILQRSA
ncbi:hypothetical protein [Brevundimonas sp. EYE_349]|uniref:hypothetical protein n=1 Tax=Brevundimonas sp. EYE_349 TaxID=2853455 RepID=UPI002004C150|nr:hypothetical protein [Brevundimonas sp. EYE_349]MCK6104972.1 hypothetical protein [Brevundimonas sp. EYE_349]